MRLRRALTMTALVLAAQAAAAGVYTFQPDPPDLYDLGHDEAYLWGIGMTVPEGEAISSASLFFDNIRDWTGPPNDLHVTLIDSAGLGVVVFLDDGNPTNYFARWGELLVHYEDLPTEGQEITYEFSASDLDTLNDYVEDGNFGLGFDPDCHFWTCGVTLTLETEPQGSPHEDPSIPEPPAGPVLLGAVGIIIARRRRRA